MNHKSFTLLVGALLLVMATAAMAALQYGRVQDIVRTQPSKEVNSPLQVEAPPRAKAPAAAEPRRHEACIDAEEACLPPEAPPVLPLTGVKILLDAGHGGSDHGAIRDGINEKDINLAVTLKLRDALLKQGATVLLTRADDSALTLDERKALIAKHAPDLFLSIHTNAHTNQNIDGIEAYYWNDTSPALAQAIYQAVVDGLGERGNWVRKRELAVVHHDFSPAALIEIGYLSHDGSRKLLVDEKYQSRVADAIYTGILEYFSNQRAGAGSQPEKPVADASSVAGAQPSANRTNPNPTSKEN